MFQSATVDDQERIAESLERDATAVAGRERTGELIAAAGYLAAVALLLVARPPGSFDVPAAAVCVLVMAGATCVRFHVPSGFTVPTQLAYVPLLFILPVALAPCGVALALMLARLPDIWRGRAQPVRLLHAIGNSWFAIGPAVVFVVAGREPSAAAWSTLLLALAAQFVTDFVTSSARDAYEIGAPIQDQLRETWVYGVDAALSPVALAVAVQVNQHPFATLAIVPLLAVFDLFARERRARLEGLIELKDAYHGTALVLGDVVEADDDYTGEHSRGVVRLVLAVGDRMGLDAESRRNLEFAAMLHDVGKIAIPKSIVNKQGKLTTDEWTIIKTHTVEGQMILERVGGLMREIGWIVRAHHERWDGSGYPDGLSGDEIPLEARIIAGCDAWNAMRTDRPYRNALSHEVAVEEMVKNSGSQFDPSVVDAVLALVKDEAAAGDALPTAPRPRTEGVPSPRRAGSATPPTSPPLAGRRQTAT